MSVKLDKGEMHIRILEDGTVVTETSDMAGAAHQKADDFLKTLARLMGGEEFSEPVKHAHGHHHAHEHTHDGVTHKH
jgi:hypothetical protein